MLSLISPTDYCFPVLPASLPLQAQWEEEMLVLWRELIAILKKAICLFCLFFGDHQSNWHGEGTATIKIRILIGDGAKDLVAVKQRLIKQGLCGI